MAYIVPFDYLRLIQEVNLQQLISGNTLLASQAQATAVEEAKSYLRAKYDVDTEFTDTALYNPGATYKAGDRVYLDGPHYNNKSPYILNAMVLRQGKVYRCSTAIPSAEEFNVSHWEYLGDQYEIFYAKFPYSVFDLKAVYAKGDHVFWNGKTYTCQIPSGALSHEASIQYNSTDNFPYPNVFPDNAKDGVKYWGVGTTYTVPAGSILNETYFEKGDNRNQQIVMYVLDMMIYHLYRRIPPQVVPELRILAYQDAKAWFSRVAKADDVVADIERVQPAQGDRIRYGSRPKLNNHP